MYAALPAYLHRQVVWIDTISTKGGVPIIRRMETMAPLQMRWKQILSSLSYETSPSLGIFCRRFAQSLSKQNWP